MINTCTLKTFATKIKRGEVLNVYIVPRWTGKKTPSYQLMFNMDDEATQTSIAAVRSRPTQYQSIDLALIDARTAKWRGPVHTPEGWTNRTPAPQTPPKQEPDLFRN